MLDITTVINVITLTVNRSRGGTAVGNFLSVVYCTDRYWFFSHRFSSSLSGYRGSGRSRLVVHQSFRFVGAESGALGRLERSRAHVSPFIALIDQDVRETPMPALEGPDDAGEKWIILDQIRIARSLLCTAYPANQWEILCSRHRHSISLSIGHLCHQFQKWPEVSLVSDGMLTSEDRGARRQGGWRSGTGHQFAPWKACEINRPKSLVGRRIRNLQIAAPDSFIRFFRVDRRCRRALT
jgi:hypothetical protein